MNRNGCYVNLYKYYVNQQSAMLRNRPNINGEVTDELLYGMQVSIENKLFDDWALVKTSYGYEGYVQNECLIKEKEQCMENNIVRAVYADVLSEPDIKSSIVFGLPKGSTVSIIGNENNGYTKIALWNGKQGYVKSSCFCLPLIGQELGISEIWREQVVRTALSYLYTPYRWGGKSPLGIDCSGLCFMSYYLNHVVIWRDSKIKEGYPIAQLGKSEPLKPADLIYFPGHIAMYIGNGNYIHATNRAGSDGVVINSLNSSDQRYREDLAEDISCLGRYAPIH